MKITANIIIKNEIDNIEKCINSVKNICSEIVVIDTGSNDGTLEYLKGLSNITLYCKEWNDNFAELRNFAKSKSNGDYILVIDGDMELINFTDKELTADYYVCDIDINGVKNPLIMLFKNIPEIYYTGKRHGTIDLSCKGLKGEVSYITFKHPELSKEELDKKIKHNLDIHLKQLIEEPENITVNYHLCRTYFYLQDYENAIQYGIKTLNSELNKEVKAITSILIYLSGIAIKQNDVAIYYLYESINYIPLQILARMLLLEFMIEQKQITLSNDLLQEISYMNNHRTRLPGDIKLTNEQLINFQNKIKEIK